MNRPSGGRLAELTHRTVVRGAALVGWVGADDLAAVLYRAGGVVVDPRIDPRWPHQLATQAHRGAGSLARHYDRLRTEHWNGWNLPGSDPRGLAHKIYVSPTVPALVTALPVVVATAVAAGVPAWKVGARPDGLHRPDKIVLYLGTAHEADQIAWALAEALTDVPAQGVPFTGQIGATGIVSRGRDLGTDSWRHVLCRTVARALTEATAASDPSRDTVAVADRALARVADRGYDVRTWSPEPAVELLGAS